MIKELVKVNQLESNPAIAEIILCNGEKNYLSAHLLHELKLTLDKLEKNLDIKVAILKGNSFCFCGGGDRETVLQHCQGNYDELEIKFPLMISKFSLPIIACAEGHAIGGGFSLALSCDFAFLSSEARYGFPYIQFRFPIHNGAYVLACERFNVSVAKTLLFIGDVKKGTWLKQQSNCNFIFPRAAVYEQALNFANELSARERFDLIQYKVAMNVNLKDKLSIAIDYEQEEMSKNMKENFSDLKAIKDYFDAF